MALSPNRLVNVTSKVGSLDVVTDVLAHVPSSLAAVVRDDYLSMVGAALREQVERNIEENRAETNTPRTNRLMRSYKERYVRGDELTITIGDGVPYASVHNLPLGSAVVIVPKNKKVLKFLFHRIQSTRFAKIVYRPGTEFFDRAVQSIKNRQAEFMRQAVSRYKDDLFVGTPYTMGSKGETKWAFGSVSMNEAVAAGLVSFSGVKARKNAVLTQKGEEYRKASRRKRRAMLRNK